MIDIDPSTEIPPEDPGCEFGYYLFDPLPCISTVEICNIEDMPVITITNPEDETLIYLYPKDPGGDVDRLLALLDGEYYEVISSLQDPDTYCHCVLQQIIKGKITSGQLYKIEKDILKCHLQIGEQIFYLIVLPHMLIGYVLELAHNKLGHNGISRTYTMLKCLYYWKVMKASIIKHVNLVTSVRNVTFKLFLLLNCILILQLSQWSSLTWTLLVNCIPSQKLVTIMLLQ